MTRRHSGRMEEWKNGRRRFELGVVTVFSVQAILLQMVFSSVIFLVFLFINFCGFFGHLSAQAKQKGCGFGGGQGGQGGQGGVVEEEWKKAIWAGCIVTVFGQRPRRGR